MIKVYVAAVAACHTGFGHKTPFGVSVYEGRVQASACLQTADASVGFRGVSGGVKRLGVSLEHPSLKTALLLALASAKRVSDIHVFPVGPSCTQFTLGNMRMALTADPVLVPKDVGSCSPTELPLLIVSNDSTCYVQFKLYPLIWTGHHNEEQSTLCLQG